MYRSIRTVKADLAQAEFGITGKDIVWAVVGKGVDASHPHFQLFRNLDLPKPLHHLDYSKFKAKLTKEEYIDFVFGKHGEGNKDFLFDKRFRVPKPSVQGLGTGVAGIIAGKSSDRGQLMIGLAPEAKILSINVYDEENKCAELDVRNALWLIQLINEKSKDLLIHGVVIALSIHQDVWNFACGQTPVCIEVDRLVNSGVVVVTTAGDGGYDEANNTSVEARIFDPGNAELGITVGATHRTSPEVYGPLFYSGRGPTADGRCKPDLLAPGHHIQMPFTPISKETPVRRKRPRKTAAAEVPDGGDYGDFDGTQFAAAHVAGAAAALLSVRRDLIGKPKEVKDILLRTAVDLGREKMYQGAGLLDVLAAVRHAVARKPAPTAAGPLKLFCSYSHHDKALWLEFKTHLSSLERAGLLEVWFDGMIEAGQRWEQEIYDKLDNADIILLLVSSYFVASEFCYSKELARALDRAAKGTVRIVPVRVRPVSLTEPIIGKLQLLPSEGKPITSLTDPHQGWAEVTDSLHSIVLKLKEKKL